MNCAEQRFVVEGFVQERDGPRLQCQRSGVGIGTGTGLALRGFQVIIPIDCMASEELYQEQYAAWHLYKAANGVAPHVTMTRTTMIKF